MVTRIALLGRGRFGRLPERALARHQGHPVKVVAPAGAVIPATVTDARTGTVHVVTDEAMIAGRRAGRYRAECGAEVLAGSLNQPPARRCPGCAERVRPGEG